MEKYLAREMKVFLLIPFLECSDFFYWLVLVPRFGRIDSACAMVESEALKGFNNKPDMFTVSSFPVTPPPANESAIDGVLRKIGEV